jgi:hypothetical protein
MSDLSKELDRYLTIRRSLGYDLGTARNGFCADLSHSQSMRAPTSLAPISSCDGRRRSAVRTGKHGRAAWELFGSLPNGYNAWMREMRCRPRD